MLGSQHRSLGSYEELSYEASRVKEMPWSWMQNFVRDGIRAGVCQLRGSSGGTARWFYNAAGGCWSPVCIHYVGRSGVFAGASTVTKWGVARERSAGQGHRVVALFGCRACEWCKVGRSLRWTKRAEVETANAACTWLGTVTLSPFHHARLDALCARLAHKRGEDLSAWTAEKLLKKRIETFSWWLTRWLKRVREYEWRRRCAYAPWAQDCNEPPRPHFSYLLVAEEHRSERTSTTMVGRPHFHLLIHEPLPFELVAQHEYYTTAKGRVRVCDGALLRAQWKLGFTQFELCRDERSASYLCKYLAKDAEWRVRSSLRYGEERSSAEHEGSEGDGATVFRAAAKAYLERRAKEASFPQSASARLDSAGA